MSRIFILCAIAVLMFGQSSAWGYGGGGGGASCSEPKFHDESPARNSVLASLSDIAVVASDNTDTSTVEVKVNGKPVKSELSRRRTGEWDVKVHLPEPIDQPGKINIIVEAKSRDGCRGLFPFFVDIRK